MACFLVPATEAIIITIAIHVANKMERNHPAPRATSEEDQTEAAVKIPFSRKLKWLSNLLWGGSVLLAFEHLWHGEVVPWFPFLTAAGNPADASAMLHEMATVGVSMAALVTLVWAGMLIVFSAMSRKALKVQPAMK